MKHVVSWKLALALGLVYLAWGTTYLAIQEGVKTLPPAFRRLARLPRRSARVGVPALDRRDRAHYRGVMLC